MRDVPGEQCRMREDVVFGRLAAIGAVPVLSFDDDSVAARIAGILVDEGLSVLEVTFRTAAAARVIATLRGRFPHLLLGAGTLLSAGQVHEAAEAGAEFGVAPGLSEATVEAARRIDLPFVPGVATPSEIERGLSYGLRTLKWFPAEPLGGAFGLAQAAAPFAHTGLRFVPSGGIVQETLAGYLRLPVVLAAAGSWMVPQQALVQGDWKSVRSAVRRAVEAVGELRQERTLMRGTT